VHNFVRVHVTTRQVPAGALGVLESGFSLNEVFWHWFRVMSATND
jgi:hypothetical protein